MVVVMGGQLYGWNVAFTTGFLQFFLCQFLTDAAYVVCMASAAKDAGKIAFSGGSYGLARITIGYYAGSRVLPRAPRVHCSVVRLGQFCGHFSGLPRRLSTAPSMIGLFLLPGRSYWRGLVLLVLRCLLLAIQGGMASADLIFTATLPPTACPNATEAGARWCGPWATSTRRTLRGCRTRHRH
ncbi:hypothetical protein SPRG_20229 [Saprolegnia parasitica CBS 223.65]|uniref:Uncharacterized protein n=1 Tax=Saprolegnia parasitica (strain CBS 223.65) TaxID=695850 RepID=A0A067CNF0_SAPPC|nr:hypothetical protein SPRG_20229 [Saprolegnia parasitica CBS 223.65]KDO28071.1 hypothetical protein SPRG_20229 [Saprolegnia parasitica CBS 223.65]|eukprot:XP_012201218.1 hypothetical protein SPRG_20229 [Saprolegnia parasitica CBS 223.65]